MSKSLLYLLPLALLALSCQQKEEPKPIVRENLELGISACESIPGINSSLSDGDEVAVFAGYSASQSFTNVLFTVEKGASVLTTKVKRAKAHKPNVALYPYSSSSSYDESSEEVSYTLPQVQSYLEGGVAPGLLPMVASSSDNNLSFKQVCGVFRISLAGAGVSVNSIEIESVKLSGAAKINAATGEMTMDDSASDKIQYKFASPVSIDTSKDFNIVLPTGGYNTIYYIVYAEDGSKMSAFQENVVIERGAVTTAACTEYKADKVETGGTDLSAMGVANCYIVSAPGDYKFAACNGAGDVISDIASVDWAWAAGEGWTSNEHEYTEILKDLAYESTTGEISFTAGETKGNIILVAKNADGKILWSWHIWYTPKPQEFISGGITMLDRNLGATSSDMGSNGSVGLLYQWGRKDPLIGAYGVGNIGAEVLHETAGANEFASGTDAATAGAGYTAYYIINSAVCGDRWRPTNTSAEGDGPLGIASGAVTDAIIAQLPTAYVHAASLMPNFNADKKPTTWMRYPTSNPCPLGYSVPSIDALNTYFGEAPTVDATNGGVKVGDAWFPTAGYRNIGSNKETLRGVGFTGRYWSDTGVKTGGSIHTTSHWYYFTTVDGIKDNSSGASKLHAASVRCIKN